MPRNTNSGKWLIEKIDDPDLLGSLGDIRRTVEEIWQFPKPRIIQYSAEHGLEHSDRVIDIASIILEGGEGKQLSVHEAYILLAGIYLHDIGMQCDIKAIPEIVALAKELGAKFTVGFSSQYEEGYNEEEQNQILNNHNFLTAAWISYAYQNKNTILGRAMRTIPEELIQDLMDVCLYHSRLSIYDCPITFSSSPNDRKQYIVAILRISSNLDIDGNRVPLENIRVSMTDPCRSLRWLLHRNAVFTLYNKNVITLSIRLHPEDAKTYGDPIRTFFMKQFTMENQPILEILKQYGNELVISAYSVISEDRFTNKLTLETIDVLKKCLQVDNDSENGKKEEISERTESISEIRDTKKSKEHTIESIRIPTTPEKSKTSPDTRSFGSLIKPGNDTVAKEDQLGYVHYIAAFADLIESIYTKPPLVIGIYGSWGSGKSFLMEHIGNELIRRKNKKSRTQDLDALNHSKVHIIRFNAWEYNSSEIIWPALVRKIMDHMEKELSWNTLDLLYAKYNRIPKQFSISIVKGLPVILAITAIIYLILIKYDSNTEKILAAFLGLGVGAFLTIISSMYNIFSNPLSQWITNLTQDKKYGNQIGYMEEIRRDMSLLQYKLASSKKSVKWYARILKILLEIHYDSGFIDEAHYISTQCKSQNEELDSTKDRILIVIDDLDRCKPRKAIEVLQSINLLLNFENFIIMLGIDSKIITRAIDKYYMNLFGASGISGYEYLEKIIQIPFTIPDPSDNEIRNFMALRYFVWVT